MFHWKTRNNTQGFTLLECLMSLFVVALITQALLLAVQSYQRVDEAVRNDYSARWYQFLSVLEQELVDYRLVDVESNRIRIQDAQGEIYTLLHKNHKIYKTRGFQPFLYEVKRWKVGYEAPFLAVVVEFDNGETYSGSVYLEVADAKPKVE